MDVNVARNLRQIALSSREEKVIIAFVFVFARKVGHNTSQIARPIYVLDHDEMNSLSINK
jgi:hypothetical protein